MSIRKNMISNLLLTSSAIVFPLITFPYITRTLSNASLGKYFFVDALTQYFIVFSAVGIPYYGIREVAKVRNDDQQRSKLVAELLAIQIGLAVIYSAILIGIHFFIPTIKNEPGMIEVSCLVLIFTSFLMEWFYQGMESFAFITSRSLIVKTISVAGILLFVKHENDYVIYYLLVSAVAVLNAGFNFFYYLKKYHHKFNDRLDIKRHIKPLLVLFSINVSVTIYSVLDTIILGLLTNPENVSYYSVPLKLARMFWLVVNGAGVVLIPRIATYFIKNDTEGIRTVMKKSLSIVFLLTIPFCYFCIVYPSEVLHLVSGDKYTASINTLRVLSIVPLIVAVFNVCGTQFLMPIGKEKIILHATIVGLIASLALNFALIPHFKYLGAAIACISAESVVCVYVFIAARKQINIDIDFPLLGQIAVSLAAIYLAKPFLTAHSKGVLLLISSACVYVAVFAILQFVLFKNSFVYSLIPLKRFKIKAANDV